MNDEPAASHLVELVALCLERIEDEGITALDSLCVANPEHASALRERIAALSATGMLDAIEPTTAPVDIAGFRVIRPLGDGGMGVVYLAEQLDLGRDVALKLVRPELLFFDGARQRFTREVDAIVRLSHPGIVSVHAAGEDKGVPYLAMEYIRGATLAEVLDVLKTRAAARLTAADLTDALRTTAPGTLDDTDSPSRPADEPWPLVVARSGAQIADALAHAHARGVLHRDVKPSNVMLTPRAHVMLMDFGLALAEGDARVTQTGAHLGSLAYMSPEQVRGAKTVNARTDIYSLGVTLYELLAIRTPYSTSSSEALRAQILDGHPPALRTINPSISTDLETVVLKAMAADPAQRYASAADLRDDLTRVVEQLPIHARPPSVARRVQRLARRHPALTTGLVLGALLTVGAPLAWAAAQREANRETTRALLAERVAKREASEALVRAQAHLADAQGAVQVISDVARRELEHVPRMGPVRQRLLEQALAFSQSISTREGDTPDVLEATARAFFRVGLIQIDFAEYTEAIPAMEAAADRARQLLAGASDAPAGLEILGRSLVERATIENMRGSPERARELRAEAAVLLERWLDATGDTEALRTLSSLRYRDGVFAIERGEFAAGERASAHAMGLSERIPVDERVDHDRKLLGLATSIHGEALCSLGRDADARAPLTQAQQLLADLREHRPHDPEVCQAFAMVHIFLARAARNLEEYDIAEAHFVTVFPLLDWLRDNAPDVPIMRAARILAHFDYASLQTLIGNVPSAVEHYVLAISLIDEDLAQPTPLPRRHGDRGLTLLSLGILLRDNDAHTDALPVLDGAIESQRRALEFDAANATWNAALFNQLWTRALVHLELGSAELCADDAHAIHTHVGTDIDGQRVAVGLLTRAAARIDDDAQERAWIDKSFVWLRALVDAGWGRPNDLENSAFDVLRSDPRFDAIRELLSTP